MNAHGPDGPDPLAAVAAWRAQGGATADPLRVGFVEALARRAAAQTGEARRLMVRRVEALLAQGAADGPASTAADAPANRRSALAGLSELVDRLGRSPGSPGGAVQPGAARRDGAPTPATLSPPTPQRELRAVAAFKGTRSRLRAEQRLRQALAQVPSKAGPLNSSNVVHRALQAMHDLSPDYLDAWMSHVDTLLWLEQSSGAADPLPRPAARADEPRRRGARPPRKG